MFIYTVFDTDTHIIQQSKHQTAYQFWTRASGASLAIVSMDALALVLHWLLYTIPQQWFCQ